MQFAFLRGLSLRAGQVCFKGQSICSLARCMEVGERLVVVLPMLSRVEGGLLHNGLQFQRALHARIDPR
jgi:hypothetical protein